LIQIHGESILNAAFATCSKAAGYASPHIQTPGGIQMIKFAKLVSAAIVFAAMATAAFAVESPAGTWQSADGTTRFEITLCGDGTEVCAKLVYLSGEAATAENMQYLNQYVLKGAKRALENKWRGEAEYLGEVVKGTMTMVSGDVMTINGCKGALCQKFELVRL
jgi:uncharacterized protein (DUF2147 family)